VVYHSVLESVEEKKVILTPKNIIINCLFNQDGFIDVPVNKGNQWTNPAIIANTAPMERT